MALLDDVAVAAAVAVATDEEIVEESLTTTGWKAFALLSSKVTTIDGARERTMVEKVMYVL